MSCSCNKKDKKVDLSINIQPFDTCLYCSFKHLSYALVLMKTEQTYIRALGQIYLAFKHVEKKYDQISKEIFDILYNYFNSLILDDKKLLEISNKIQDLTKNDDIGNQHATLNLEQKKLYNQNLKFLYLAAIQELYEYEVGYQKINSPWIMGLLQRACENSSNIDKMKIREIWKKYEITNELPLDFYHFLNDQYQKNILYIKSINKLNNKS